MSFAICSVSIAPLRSASADRSEMISQLLFGEMVEILEEKGRAWKKVRCLWDQYIGWVDSKQIEIIPARLVKNYQEEFAYSFEWALPASHKNHFLPLPLGAVLPQYDGMQFYFKEHQYQFNGQVLIPDQQVPSVDLMIKIARKYLYAPYLWGGRSPFGIDCSGYTQMVYKLAGISLPRDAKIQVSVGDTIDFFEQADIGDLLFFENRTGSITHVGILIEDGKIIHASGMVRIDKVDHFGIYHEEEQRYTHKLRVIKRIWKHEKPAKKKIPSTIPVQS